MSLHTGCIMAVTIAVGCLHPICATAQDQMERDARAAIQAIVDKINLAWEAEDAAALFREILSDQSFAVAFPRPDDPSKARVFSRDTFCEHVEKLIREGRRPQHAHRVQSITVAGPLAYEIGTIEWAPVGGDKGKSDVLNIFAHQDTGWKLVCSTSAENVRRALRSDSTDEEALRELSKEYVAAFRTRNPTPFERLEEILADDVIAVMSTGRMVAGKVALIESYRQAISDLRQTFRTFRLHYEIMSVKLIGDGAVVFGKLLMKGRVHNTDEQLAREVWETLVFRRDSDGWRIVEEHSTQGAPSGLTKLWTRVSAGTESRVPERG